MNLLAIVGVVAMLSWKAPTQNVDGSPITCLDSYDIYVGTSSRVYGTEVNDIPNTDLSLNYEMGSPDDVEYFFAITATDCDGNESAYSNEVSKVNSVPPGPEPIQTLQVAQTVFTMIKQPNKFFLLPIGTVPAGTPCDPNNSVNGMGAVPVSAVEWTCQEVTCARPIVVVAQCDGV